jgi:hypothetical protein
MFAASHSEGRHNYHGRQELDPSDETEKPAYTVSVTVILEARNSEYIFRNVSI